MTKTCYYSLCQTTIVWPFNSRTVRSLPAKKRLILHLIIGLITLVSGLTSPSQTQATAISNSPAVQTPNSYSVLHADSSSLKQPKATAGTMASQSVVTAEGDQKVYQGPKEVESIVKTYFKDIPLLADIAKCESHYQQYYKSGNVYRGAINTSDVGVMQINEKYHLKTAEKMGIDIYSLDGNMAYARYLYTKEGSGPWNSSGACWDNSQTASKVANVASK